MVMLFYISGFFAIVTTVCALINTNPIHALLYLIVSLLSVSLIFFSVKASFAGIIEIIIYAGAIMVLFLFAIMMLNLNNPNISSDYKEPSFFSLKKNVGIFLLMSNLLMFFLTVISKKNDFFINIFEKTMSIKGIGIMLFSSYILVVEIASFLLLSSLVSVLHIIQKNDIISSFISTQLSSKYKK